MFSKNWLEPVVLAGVLGKYEFARPSLYWPGATFHPRVEMSHQRHGSPFERAKNIHSNISLLARFLREFAGMDSNVLKRTVFLLRSKSRHGIPGIATEELFPSQNSQDDRRTGDYIRKPVIRSQETSAGAGVF